MADSSVTAIDGRAVVRVAGSELLDVHVGQAVGAADAAADSQAAAELAAATALAASRYFATKAAGESGSTAGQLFSTDDGAGNLIYYRKLASGSAEIARAVTPAALASAGGSSQIGFTQAGSGAVLRTARDKLRETVSITDYASGTDWSVLADSAVAALGQINPVRLLTPAGAFTSSARDYSAYRNITFAFENPRINHGTAAIVLPDQVEGAENAFIGTGSVTQKNKDETPLQEPPGGYKRVGNDARGIGALAVNIGGTNNLAWGFGALAANKYGRSAIAIGNGALSSLVGDATGARARVNGSTEILSYGAPGDFPIAIGDHVLESLTTGTECLGIGILSLQKNVSGHCNVAVGSNSQILATTASFNVSLGCYALVNNTSSINIAIGWAALEGQQTGSNVAIGHVAMNGNVTGSLNVAIGPLALSSSANSTRSVVIGQEAARNAKSGNDLAILGAYALGQVNTGGCNGSTAIGSDALLMLTTGDNNTAIGHGSLSNALTVGNCFGIGSDAQVTGSNQGQFGNTMVTSYHYGLQARSDARDKADIRDTVLGLDFINALRPVDYRWNMRDDYRDRNVPRFAEVEPQRPREPIPLNDNATEEQRDAHAAATLRFGQAIAAYETVLASHNERQEVWRSEVLEPWQQRNTMAAIQRGTSKKRTRYHHGLIAQEVREVIEETGIDFGGFQDHAVQGGEDVLSLGYDELIAPLIKAVQQLAAKVSDLETRS